MRKIGTYFRRALADSESYNACRGITCAASEGGNNANNAGSCTGASDCPGTVCCDTGVSVSCVPDEMTCGLVMGTVVP